MTSKTPVYKIEPTRELLLKAAEILRQRGLNRDKFIDPASGKVCMLGAAALAAGLTDTDDAAYMTPVHEFLAEMLNGGQPDYQPFVSITRFNDHAESVEEVASFLERAAQELPE